jgi:uncharacterized membrane protein required for colicin V production
MNAYLGDIILLLVIVGFAGKGKKNGFIKTLGSVLGGLFAIIVSEIWIDKLCAFLTFFAYESWVKLIAFVVVFIVAGKIFGFIFGLIDGVFEILAIFPFLKSANSLLGAVLGFIEGLLLAGGAIYFIQEYGVHPSVVSCLKTSALAPWISGAFQPFLAFFR